MTPYKSRPLVGDIVTRGSRHISVLEHATCVTCYRGVDQLGVRHFFISPKCWGQHFGDSSKRNAKGHRTDYGPSVITMFPSLIGADGVVQ